MSDLSNRIADLSPAKRELLVQQLKKKTGIVHRTGSSLRNNSTTGLDLNTEAV